MKTKTKVVLFLSMFVLPFSGWSQTEPDEIAMVSDRFQDDFYESLLQKGIENYDKAIVALQKCLVSQPNNPTLYFELGKNYMALKQYENAYLSFQKATEIDPKNKWFWVGMYDLSFQTKNYDRALTAVQQLISFDDHYTDDLIPIYMAKNELEKALALISDMNTKYGKTFERTQFRNQILLANENQPSDWKEVTDFKNFLDDNDGNQAVQTMNSILANPQIPNSIKHRILNEFLIFVLNNPQFDEALDNAILLFDSDKDVNIAQVIGKFYQNKKQTDKAIHFYELALQKSSGTMETNLLLLQDYIGTQQFQKLAQKAEKAIELYPSQPYFYYYSGLANNQLHQYKKAKDILEMGFEYVIDNLNLEIDFYLQLSDAYDGLGDIKRKDSFSAKAKNSIQKKGK